MTQGFKEYGIYATAVDNSEESLKLQVGQMLHPLSFHIFPGMYLTSLYAASPLDGKFLYGRKHFLIFVSLYLTQILPRTVINALSWTTEVT